MTAEDSIWPLSRHLNCHPSEGLDWSLLPNHEVMLLYLWREVVPLRFILGAKAEEACIHDPLS
jgi:hypothetical protein